MLGIVGLSGFVCIFGLLDFLYVFFVIGLLYEIVYGLLRFIVGDFIIDDDIDYILENLLKVIERFRSMLLFYDDVKK